jgi:predicted permease
VLFGIAPALRFSNPDVHGSLKDVSRGSSGAGSVWGRGQRLRRGLIVAELALSVMLLVGAGLLIRSFIRLQSVSPGFDATGVLTLELTMTGRKYNEPELVLQTYRALWDRLGRLPGVDAAGGVTALPLSNMMAWGPITVEGRAAPDGEKFINADIRAVGGRYFAAMGIPLIRGRLFDDRDTRESARVVLVDEHMAAQLWPGQDPIGRRIRIGGFDVTPDTPWMTVIGVVGRVKQDSLDGEPRMAYYRYQGQTGSRALTVVIRTTASDPASLSNAVRQQIRELDADLPIYKMRAMRERVSESLAERRFAMLLLTLFALFALVLAAVGVYGVLAYLVAQGTRELGIRLALGATPSALARLVVWQGMSVAFAGVALGLAGAFVLTRFMRSLLFGVAATDPSTFVAIASALTVVALAASYLPARRAAAVDPIVSLRAE